jgi:hypothetical protein
MNFLPSKIITTTAKNPQEEEIPTARFIPTSSSSSVLASKLNVGNNTKIYQRPRPQNIPNSLNAMQSMKGEVDRIYLSKTRGELMQRYKKFIELNDNFLPKELNDPDDGYDGRFFYVLWSRGTEESTPTKFMDLFLAEEPIRLESWRKKNELNYYSSVYKALTSPLGGNGLKKMKGRKHTKRRKNARKTRRKINK